MASDGSADTIVVKRLIACDPQSVFNAFTDPKIMCQWFFVGENSSCDACNTLEVGGTYKVVMHHADGNRSVHTGVYKSIEPPHRLVFTWDIDDYGETLVSIEFRAKGGHTELVLMHDMLATQALRDMHAFGWNACLDSLKGFFERH